ncbi:hypothetical protein [Streptomyces sp. NPDC044948]
MQAVTSGTTTMVCSTQAPARAVPSLVTRVRLATLLQGGAE